ncbi:hypothetical protein D3C73_1159710 [compost metagenome]
MVNNFADELNASQAAATDQDRCVSFIFCLRIFCDTIFNVLVNFVSIFCRLQYHTVLLKSWNSEVSRDAAQTYNKCVIGQCSAIRQFYFFIVYCKIFNLSNAKIDIFSLE